ncbi:MAG: trehalase family glycosidase [Pseudomonadota bacterium]|nr:trehalase family glycosidase [Pseudomonadota bacterium]
MVDCQLRPSKVTDQFVLDAFLTIPREEFVGKQQRALAYIDEDRAWTEVETLFNHQWDDGMVPHIVFHAEDDGYFPGPDVWSTGHDIPTSGITQPAVAGFAVNRLFERAKDKQMAARRATALLPKIARWHDWFYNNRDPEHTGLVAIIHPWESGRDNSVDWDIAFERVPTEGVMPFVRRDTQHADPDHRPTQSQYERYIWLVQLFRSLNWDNARLHDASPFKIVDPGFNAILIRSCADLARLATALGADALAATSAAQAEQGLSALEQLWSEQHGQYLCLDRMTGALIDSLSVGGLLPAFAPLPEARAAALASRLNKIGEQAGYLVPSHDLNDPDFDHLRYWRGPAWLIVNYMIADGLEQAGQTGVVSRIVNNSLQLIEQNGFAEYYSPLDGTACGGTSFSWTAAMVMEFLNSQIYRH